MVISWRSLICFIAVICCLLRYGEGAVIAIDFGTEWVKVAVAKAPNIREIVLNSISKRKTAAGVTIRGLERVFDGDSVKYPKDSYFNLKTLMGRFYSDSHAAEYRSQFSNEMVENGQRGTVSFKGDGETQYFVEELVGYLFQHLRENVEKQYGDVIYGTVITVPPYFNQFQRKAILDAAELAGLRVLSLLGDDCAVALQHIFLKPESFYSSFPLANIVYDIGSGSSSASLVVYSYDKSNLALSLEVKAVGFDPTLGGHEIDKRLQKHLGDIFLKKNPKVKPDTLHSNLRAMARLLKEAKKVKEILSANDETFASLETLVDDYDLKTKVTRSELEALCLDLKERVVSPLKKVLAEANVTLDGIQSIILFGGGSRVPFISDTIVKFAGESKISREVDRDESAVMGGVYWAAYLNRQLARRNTRKIFIKELNLFDVEMKYNSLEKGPKEKVLFAEKAQRKKKIYSVKEAVDVSTIHLAYGKSALQKDPNFGPLELFEIKLSDTANLMEKYSDAKILSKGLKFVFDMDDYGLINMTQSQISIEYEKEVEVPKPKEKTLTEKVMSFFGGGKDNSTEKNSTSEESFADSKDEKVVNEPSSSENSTLSKDEPIPSQNTTTKEIKKFTENLIVLFDYIGKSVLPVSESERVSMSSRSSKMTEFDQKKLLRSEARNNLDSKYYGLKDKLENDAKFLNVIRDSEKQQLVKVLEKLSEWLEDIDEDTVSYDELKKQIDAVELIDKPIFKRLYEFENRPMAISELASVIDDVKDWIAEQRTKFPEEESRGATNDDLEKLEKLALDHGKWIKEEKPEFDPKKEDPKVLCSDINSKKSILEQMLNRLKVKKAPKKTTSTTTSASSSSTSTTSSESPSSSPIKDDKKEL